MRRFRKKIAEWKAQIVLLEKLKPHSLNLSPQQWGERLF